MNYSDMTPDQIMEHAQKLGRKRYIKQAQRVIDTQYMSDEEVYEWSNGAWRTKQAVRNFVIDTFERVDHNNKLAEKK